MQDANRVLVIGLDGATWDVLEPWIADGSLPNLGRLRQCGSWGALQSTLPPISAPAWTSFITGKGPGKHGVFHFIDQIYSQQEIGEKPRLVTAASIQSPTIWDVLGHHDLKMASINMPMTYPPRPVNGILITGLLTPKNAAVFTWPPELASELVDYMIDLDRFVDTKPFQVTYDGPDVAPTLALVGEFRDMLDKRTRNVMPLLRSRPWNAFTVVFTGTDRMGHYLWPYHHTPAADDPPQVQELCQAVHDYYVRLDSVIGELVAAAGEDVNVIVMSDHGMGPRNSKRLHLNNWLWQKGWLVTQNKGAAIKSPDTLLKKLGLSRDKVGRLLSRVPGLVKSRFVRRAAQVRTMAVDRQASRAYIVPIWGNLTGIRVNSAADQDSLCQQIMRELYEITDPETGQPVIKRAFLGRDSYQGPFAGNVPEIIVELDPDYVPNAHLGTYSSVVTRLQYTSTQGYHRPEGILIAYGPDIVAQAASLANLHIEDLAPTILYLLGLAVPSDMDGHVLTPALDPELVALRPVQFCVPTGFWPSEQEANVSSQMTDEDEADVRDRLRALGYLG